MAELGDQDKELLRQVFMEAMRRRVLEDDLEAARDCGRLLARILYPPVEVDWSATRLGRRVAARDARRA